MSSSWLRIAVVQFAPKLGQVHANIAKARELCRGLTPRSVDLVCFPEMAFTGYMFPDAPSIAPYLEHPTTGPTASFCAELARRLQCFVVAGFPERLEELPADAVSSASSGSSPEPGPGPELELEPVRALMGANAALVYDAGGHLVHTYHKHNLFPTDRTWARPGRGFRVAALDLELGVGIGVGAPRDGRLAVAVAICNDLNVAAGEAWVSIEHGPYELAGWCVREGVRVLVLLNAWLRPGDGGMEGVEEEDGEGEGSGELRGVLGRGSVAGAGADADAHGEGGCDSGSEDDGVEPNWEVLNYWAMRLRPLWAPSDSGDTGTKTDAEERASERRDVIVVVCNRFGREQGKTFAGSSAMFAMRPGSGRPRLLHFMGQREEGVCVWTAKVGS